MVRWNRDSEGFLCLGRRRLQDLVADPAVGTPTYVYDLEGIEAEAQALIDSFEGASHVVAYAVKANHGAPIVRALGALGCGADIVSLGELKLAMACGISPDRIVYSGVAKTNDEIDAALSAGPRGILALQLESLEELERVDARARALGKAEGSARVSLRINPSILLEDLATHEHIATGHDEAKFGVPFRDLGDAFQLLREKKFLRLVGVGAHVGSQLVTVRPMVDAAKVVFDVARDLRAQGLALDFVDVGGGFGIDYGEGCHAKPADFARAALRLLQAEGLGDLQLLVEPGRALVGPFGVLLARVLQEKRTRHDPAGRRWLMIDAGMNDLMRPALYGARHRVEPLWKAPVPEEGAESSVFYRVVGPVCESADDFGEHGLPSGVPTAVALLDAGAYGFSMASVYNARPLPAEVYVRGERAWVHRRKGVDEWLTQRLAPEEPLDV